MDIKSKEAHKRVKKIKQLHKEKAVFLRLGEKLRAYFFTGVLVTAPVAITFYVAYNIFIWIDGWQEVFVLDCFGKTFNA